MFNSIVYVLNNLSFTYKQLEKCDNEEWKILRILFYMNTNIGHGYFIVHEHEHDADVNEGAISNLH